MRRTAAIVAVAFLAAPGHGAAAQRAPAPAVNYYAKFSRWGSKWGGMLDAMLGGRVFLDPSSSQPKGFLSRIYDGNPGTLLDPTGSFLIFDGPRAAFRVVVPAWREVDAFGFYALEARAGSRATARLVFAQHGSAPRTIRLSRHVLDTRQGMAHVEYRSASHRLPLSGGEFRLEYTNPDFASAFVSEIVLDDIGDTVASASRVRHAGVRLSQLLFWEHVARSTPDAPTLHSLLIHVSNTGAPSADVTAAWVAQPAAPADSPVPLVVLVQDPASPHAAPELVGLAGRPEFALAPDLARRGAAVLVVDLPRRLPLGARYPDAYLDRLKSALDQVLEGEFARHSGLRVDRGRIGLWGYGDGATLAMRAASADPRYSFVALSHLPHSFCDAMPPGADCDLERTPISELAGDFLNRWQGTHAVVITDREGMAWWLDRRARGDTRLKVFASASPALGRGERRAVIDFLSGAAGLREEEGGVRVPELASTPADAESSEVRAMRSRRELESALRGN